MPRQRIPDFRCQVCPSIYLSQTGLDGHMGKEHGREDATPAKEPTPSLPTYVPRNRSVTFNCTLCNHKYLQQSGLDKHMEKDHTTILGSGVELVSPKTMVMNRPTNSRSIIDSPSSHTPRRRTQDFKCQYCPPEHPSIYLTETGLAKHVEKQHSNPPAEQLNPDWKPVDIIDIFQRAGKNASDAVEVTASNAVNVTKKEEKRNIAGNSKHEEKRTKRKSKKEKDPNAPKRPLTAYFLFMGDVREKVKASNPDFTVTEVGKELGERWQNLDAGTKKIYQEKATNDRARYDVEMKEYLNSRA